MDLRHLQVPFIHAESKQTVSLPLIMDRSLNKSCNNAWLYIKAILRHCLFKDNTNKIFRADQDLWYCFTGCISFLSGSLALHRCKKMCDTHSWLCKTRSKPWGNNMNVSECKIREYGNYNTALHTEALLYLSNSSLPSFSPPHSRVWLPCCHGLHRLFQTMFCSLLKLNHSTTVFLTRTTEINLFISQPPKTSRNKNRLTCYRRLYFTH